MATKERDRSGRPFHQACVDKTVATVVEEARPSRDPHDLAERVRRDRNDGPDAGGGDAGGVARLEAVLYAAVGHLVGEGRSLR